MCVLLSVFSITPRVVAVNDERYHWLTRAEKPPLSKYASMLLTSPEKPSRSIGLPFSSFGRLFSVFE